MKSGNTARLRTTAAARRPARLRPKCHSHGSTKISPGDPCWTNTGSRRGRGQYRQAPRPSDVQVHRGSPAGAGRRETNTMRPTRRAACRGLARNLAPKRSIRETGTRPAEWGGGHLKSYRVIGSITARIRSVVILADNGRGDGTDIGATGHKPIPWNGNPVRDWRPTPSGPGIDPRTPFEITQGTKAGRV
jgi:hypothetical protein